jgi:ABC-type polysaccharide/polyol phosphate export permease
VEVENFPYFLLMGLLPWSFFSHSLMMATGSIVENASLIRKVWLPVEVFPVATVLFNLTQYLLALAVLLPLALLLFHVRLSWSVMAFFPVLAFQVLFTLGLSFVISTANVFYRDVRHFAEILLMLLFWLTPIVYDIRAVPESLSRIIYLNPVSLFIISYQDIFCRQTFPDASHSAALMVVGLLSFLFGRILFSSYQSRFAEEV